MNKIALLKVARDAIKSHFNPNLHIDKPKYDEKLATFVTLTKDGNLRGCIGSIIAHKTVVDDIIYNAKVAAFNDLRFMPISEDELKEIIIEISILTPPKAIEYENIEDLKSKIVPNVDGVILSYEGKQATFLPQVWEQLIKFDDFFSHLGAKANLGANVLKLHPNISTYKVEYFKEK